jgi:hypothetical protein
MSMSESGRNPPLVAEPKIKTCVAPILRNRFAAAVRASFSMKTVVIFDPQPAVLIAAFSRSDYITLRISWSRPSGSGVGVRWSFSRRV